MNGWVRQLGWRLLPGATVAFLVLLLLRIGAWGPLEQIAYHLLFRLRGPVAWDSRVVVITIDEASLAQLGRFPWPRQEYAKLLQVLTPARPSVVVLDLLFPEQSLDDASLATAIAQQGHVVLAQAGIGEQSLHPTPVLRDAAIATGHVLKREDTDGISRTVGLQEGGLSSLGLMAVKVYSLVQAPVTLPDFQRPFWVNWPGPVELAPQYSFVQVVRGQVPAAAFQEKIVLVGVTAAALDPLQTPFNRNPPTSGVFLHATVVHNILQQNALRVWPTEWVIWFVVLGGPGLALVLPRQRPGWQLSVWLGGCLLWSGVSLLGFQSAYLLPVAMPLILVTLTSAAVVLQEQWELQARLRQSEERYALAVQGSNEGLWDWDFRTGRIYYAPRWKSILGYGETEIGDRPQEWFDRIHPEDRELVQQAIAAHLEGRSPDLEIEHRMLRRQGDYCWVLCRGVAVRDATGTAYRMAGSQTDITQRKQAEAALQHQAFYDALTGLPNRACFLDHLRQALERLHPQPTARVAVLFLDLDQFKVVNDSLGHAAGDRLLVAIAQRLSACLGCRDVLARLGGDGFTILADAVPDSQVALQLADRIHHALTTPFYLDGQDIFVTVSIGIALGETPDDPAETLLRHADTAMYRAKALGRARSEVFHSAMHTRAVALLQLDTDLRQAIDRQEFQLYYQPIISLQTGSLNGFEALVRWHHPRRGLVSPTEFIAVAEETGLIGALGQWILRQACQQLQAWQQQFPDLPLLTMSVNLSGIQLIQTDLMQQIDRILAETGISGANLKLEITESAMMLNMESAIALLYRLRDRQIHLCIDDFGTGYSSLGRLHRLPINVLKIDRAFVNRLDHGGEGWEIVWAIMTLAQSLNLDVIAEGIETPDQLHQLKDLNCEYGQGYLFAKPLDVAAATQVLATPPRWTEPLLG